MAMKKLTAGYEEEMHVSTIELFFDLVFVFTVTQLTHLNTAKSMRCSDAAEVCHHLQTQPDPL